LTKIFKNKNKPLFVSKSDRIEERGNYAVILSPEFYWIKSAKLPVTKVKDAIKLAPSVYEGSLPEGDFSFEARKVGDDFIMIAYNKKQITKELEKVLPYKSDIKEVYFAQDALSHIKECTSVNERAALSNMNGIIIQVPRSCTNTSDTLDAKLADATFGKSKVKLSSFDNELLSSKDIMLIASIVGLLFVALIGEYIVYKKALSDLEERRSEIIANNDLPRTSIQLKSIKKSLTKKFKMQKALRERLFAISKMKLEKGEYIQSIEEGTKGMTLEIFMASKEREAAIKKGISKTLKIKESSVLENILTLKVAS